MAITQETAAEWVTRTRRPRRRDNGFDARQARCCARAWRTHAGAVMKWSRGPAVECDICDRLRCYWRLVALNGALGDIPATVVIMCRSCWREWHNAAS